VKGTVKWVRDALAATSLVDHLAHYLIRDNMIHASDGRMVVAHPFEYDGEVLVNGEGFEKLLARMPVDAPILGQTETHLVMRHGKFKGSVKTLPPEQWVYPPPDEGAWHPLPEGLLAAMRRLRPFLSANATQPWATCLAYLGGHLYATNNITLARTPLRGRVVEGTMFPVWAVDFVLARDEGLVEWMCSPQALAFSWDTGAWMRTPTIVTPFPGNCPGMIDAGKGARRKPHTLTPEWRAALERVSGFAEAEVQLGSTMMRSAGEAVIVEDEVGTPCPPDVEFTCWDHRYLEPVVTAATHWDPTTWPSPAYFKGKALEGIILGRRAS